MADDRKPRLKGLDEDDLKRIVNAELSLAEDARSAILTKSTKALEYFQGTMKDITPEAGRSKAVSLDLADTMGWILPGVIRVFTASQHMAIVEPAGTEDEEWAENATDGVNYDFWKENDGYRIIHSATWDSLLTGNGVVKVWYDDTPQKSVSFHSGLDDIELAQLVGDDDVEVLEHSERQQAMPSEQGDKYAPPPMPPMPSGAPPGVPPEMAAAGAPEGVPPPGMEMPPEMAPPMPLPAPPLPAPPLLQTYTVHDVKIERTKDRTRDYGCIKIECIAPEDYGKNDEAKTCDEARFQYHRARKTRSELIEMGFAREDIEKIGKATEWDSPQEVARNRFVHEWDGDTSTEIIDLYECYMKVDINDDGIAETLKVDYAGHRNGGTILDWQEWEDETPFQDIPCDPMPHRWEARSIADETIDVQQIKTALLRQGLDNTYATSNPQRFVTGTIKNPEALFSPMFGETIFGEPGAQIVPMPVPFVSDKVFDAVLYMDQVIERRTGVSKTTMALDPEALQNQTATAVQAGRDAAYSQIELIARNQAELGWRKVFKKILLLEIKHRDKPRQIRMHGKPVVVDPRHWNADMDVSINVGLGTGSRDRDMQILNQVKQDLMTLAGAAGQQGYQEVAVQILPYLLKTMHKFGEASGLHNPELFYPEIGDEEVLAMQQQIAQQKSQPDPKLQAEQMKQQMEGQKLQMDMQAKQAEMQMKQMELQARLQAEQEKAAAQIRREQAQMEADMQVRALDSQFKEKELLLKAELEREKMSQERELKLIELGLKADDETDGMLSSLKVQTEQTVMAALQALSLAVADLKAGATLPKRIVRDPVSGKVMGMETFGMEAEKVVAAQAANGTGTVQ